MPSCLIANPVSNANILVRYLKERGVDCYAIIELDKVAQIPHLNPKKKSDFDASLYKGIFTSEQELPLAESGLFDAVLAGSENGVFLAERLAAHYSVPGNDPATSARRRCKDSMQAALTEAGLASIPTLVMSGQAEADAALAGWSHYPCVLKPQSSAGGEHVQRCNDAVELKRALASIAWGAFSATWTHNETFLLQPMVEGPEYVVDLVAHAGQYSVSSVCRYVRSDDLDITDCNFVKKFTFILPLENARSQVLIDYAKRAAAALDIAYGAVHMELLMADTGPVMIEAGARMHGTITPTLFTHCYSSSLLEQLYEVYFGNPAHVRDAAWVAPAVVSDVICVKTGICLIDDAQLQRALGALPSLKGYSCGVEEGDRYELTQDLLSSPMNACFCTSDLESLWRDVAQFEDIAERSMGGGSLSEGDWQRLRQTYDAYLAV